MDLSPRIVIKRVPAEHRPYLVIELIPPDRVWIGPYGEVDRIVIERCKTKQEAQEVRQKIIEKLMLRRLEA